MYKSKLVRLYQTLDDAEIRQLKKWLKSPIHNKHKDVQKLFDYLLTRKTINENTVYRDKIFAYLYPKETMNMARLRHVMSFATDVLEDFICYQEYRSNTKRSEMMLLSGLRKRELKKDANRQAQAIRRMLDGEEVLNEDYYWFKYQLEVEEFELATVGDQPTSTNLQAVMDSSSLFFVLRMLRYACISITHQTIYKTTYSIPFIDPIVAAIKSGTYAHVDSIQLYYACYWALTVPEEEEPYEILKRYLRDFPNILPAHEFREVYGIAINYCIRKLNKGDRYYAEEAFGLYMRGIDNEILLDKGILSHFAYKNIVAIGLFLGRIDEIRDFIPKGEYLLHTDYRKSYTHYNQAKFYFATNEYDKVKELLRTIEYDDLFMNVTAKMMLLKIYVEEGDFDLVEAYVHSFTQFLRRKSEMGYHKTSFMNTIRLTQRVMHAFTKEEKSQLIEEIQAASGLPERKWLLEQLGVVE